jgi:Co/Zn/Cd efflux system component
MRDSSRDQMQEPANDRKLLLATVLTLGFAGVEAVAGWWSGSLALLSDAGHMATDAAALLIAALADGSLGAGLRRSTPTDSVARNWSRRW